MSQPGDTPLENIAPYQQKPLAYESERLSVCAGDCLDLLTELPDDTVDAVITDPPYALAFMGKDWDRSHPDPAIWKECFRALKPGGHLLTFGGTRTWHRLACDIEDAGFEMRDSIAWLCGSGFPKSMDVSKAIDKAAGSADDAKVWQGWGTALKPAFEPVVCARKPFSPVPLDWRLVATVHHALAGLLWLSLSDVKRVETLSASRNPEQHGAWCASALVSAATGTSLDEFAKTATFNSQATASTCWNIASSWSAILAALSDPTSMSTTSTRSSTITGLRTLNSLLAPVISLNTMPACECLTAGASSLAPSAVGGSTGEWPNWMHTLSASAPASAIEGIALAARAVLVNIADELSTAQQASTAQQIATTGAESNGARPAFEPIIMARKPFKGTVAANVLAHGTGALNIDACRVATTDKLGGGHETAGQQMGDGWHRPWMDDPAAVEANAARARAAVAKDETLGRWPANVVMDESQAAVLDSQTEPTKSSGGKGDKSGKLAQNVYGDYAGTTKGANAGGLGDEGGVSRYFPTFKYQAKAPKKERPTVDGISHATVKPLELMRWLVRLVTPVGGVVLDPFAGSGTTGQAALMEGCIAVLCEREESYIPLILHRLAEWVVDEAQQPKEDGEGAVTDIPLENIAPYQQKPGGTGGNIFCSSRHPTDPDVWCRRFPDHEGNHRAYVFSIVTPDEWENQRG